MYQLKGNYRGKFGVCGFTVDSLSEECLIELWEILLKNKKVTRIMIEEVKPCGTT